MKIQEKHIIIAIVVAVAAYLLWRRSRGTEVEVESSSTVTVTDPESFETVIAVSGMTATEANYARKFKQSVEASEMRKSQVEVKAAERGLTYAQMLALDALWVLYYDNATSDFKEGTSNSTKSHVWKVQSNIKSI